MDYSAETQAPQIFRKWAAAATISGALERKVWMKIWSRTLYPNEYVLLIGGPGVGKTDALRNVLDMWSALPNIHVAPSSVSRASLTDALNEAERSVLRPTENPPLVQFNSLQVASTEFGTFFSAYETEFLSTLNDLFDCVPYKEKKRHMNGKAIIIPNPQLSIIAGTTPAWLGSVLPETAWGEGFSSRLVLIYSGERVKVDPFAATQVDEEWREKLKEDLVRIHNMYGQFSFDDDVVEAFRNWYNSDCPPIPQHPKLEHYLPRRPVHLLKLMMVMSASRGSDYLITMIDYQRALDMLLEAEFFMPDVFKSMRYNSDSNVMDECYNFCWTIFAKEGKDIAEHRIIHFLSQRMPSHQCSKVLEVMISANILTITNPCGLGGRKEYRPAPKVFHET